MQMNAVRSVAKLLILHSFVFLLQPLEKCVRCGVEYPLDELQEHIKECKDAG